MESFEKFLKWVGIIILILIIVLGILTVLNIVTFVAVFNWVQHGVYRVTGLDPALAKAIAAILVAVIVAFPLGAIVKSFTPIPQKNKGAYRSSIFLVIAVVFLFIYFGGKKTFFDPQTGESIKYYIQYPNGKYKISTEPGYDPVTGEKLKRVTKEVALKLAGLEEEPEPIEPVETFQPEPAQPVQSEPPPVATAKTATPAYEEDPIKPAKKVASKPKEEAIPETSYVKPEISDSTNYRPFKENYDTEPVKVEPVKRVEKRVTDQESDKFKENVYQAYNDARPLLAFKECQVEFHNFSLKTVIIANFSKTEVGRVSFESDAILFLRPGRYYMKTVKASSWQLFIVPDKSSYTVNIEKSPSPSTDNRTIQNNNRAGDEIPAVIHRYYGNYDR